MLNAKNLGLSFGIVWGVSVWFVTILSMFTGYGDSFIHMMQSVYPGYSVDLLGSFIGLIYGFVDGFVGLFIFGLIYNWLTARDSASRRKH
ncbi:MAG: bacteriophage holin [Waddliaceae bacterium]